MPSYRMATALSAHATPGSASTLRWSCWKSPGTRHATFSNNRWAQKSIPTQVMGAPYLGCTKNALN